MKRAALAILLSVISLGASASAQSTQFDASGDAVHWFRADTPLIVDTSGAPSAFADLQSIASRAADTWNAVPGTTHLSPVIGVLGPVGYDSSPNAENHSGVTVSTTGLPGMQSDALAITLVTTRHDTGEILDTDVIFNARDHVFAALDAAGMLGRTDVLYDIQNVLTHEMGHVLGLVEDAANPHATMYPSSAPGEVSKRTLSDIDIASVQRAYGYGTPSTAEATPTAVPATAAGCGGARVAPARGRSQLPWGVCALIVLAAAVVRPRRSSPLFMATAAVLLIAAAPSPDLASQIHHVVSHASRWTRGVIVTTATVRGSDGSERTVDVIGGRVGDLEMHAYGTPSGTDIEPGAAVQLSGDRVMRIDRLGVLGR